MGYAVSNVRLIEANACSFGTFNPYQRLHLAAIVRSDTTAGADTASEVCLMAPSSRLADGVPNGGLTVVIQGSL